MNDSYSCSIKKRFIAMKTKSSRIRSDSENAMIGDEIANLVIMQTFHVFYE